MFLLCSGLMYIFVVGGWLVFGGSLVRWYMIGGRWWISGCCGCIFVVGGLLVFDRSLVGWYNDSW